MASVRVFTIDLCAKRHADKRASSWEAPETDKTVKTHKLRQTGNWLEYLRFQPPLTFIPAMLTPARRLKVFGSSSPADFGVGLLNGYRHDLAAASIQTFSD